MTFKEVSAIRRSLRDSLSILLIEGLADAGDAGIEVGFLGGVDGEAFGDFEEFDAGEEVGWEGVASAEDGGDAGDDVEEEVLGGRRGGGVGGEEEGFD